MKKLKSYFREKLAPLFDIKLWKFLLVGVLNTAVGNGLMFLLYNLVLPQNTYTYWVATAVSYALASILSYFLNRYFTFKYQGSGWAVVFRFALNIAVCYLLAYGPAKWLICWILSDASIRVRDNAAMLAGMVLYVGFNYLGQRFFAFRERKDTPPTE